jgi:signal transduction histidine kinase
MDNPVDPGKPADAAHETWWDAVTRPNPAICIILIIAGTALELYVHAYLGITAVYSHFFYLVIIITGIWYGRRAIVVAIFFGALNVGVTYVQSGTITVDVFLRAVMFIIVAFVTGTLVEQMRADLDRYERQDKEIALMKGRVTAISQQLELCRIDGEAAKRKLGLLSLVTRNYIPNQLTALLGYIDLAKAKVTDPEMQDLFRREETVAQIIRRQVEFSRTYEEIGAQKPRWLNVDADIRAFISSLTLPHITFTLRLDGLEIFADPLFEKVYADLIDNSLRHGVRVKNITFSYMRFNGDIAIVYEDDGIGIHAEDKERIFEKGVGRYTGFGLFLSREILGITGLSITERGTYGQGARFEILVPAGKFRFTGREP